MAKPLRVFGSPLRKPRIPQVPEALKSEISSKAQQLVEQHLKPAHVEQPENPQCNYIADIYTRWHRDGISTSAPRMSLLFLTLFPRPLKSPLREWGI